MSRQPEPTDAGPVIDLQQTGLLWLINRVVFHPRGFALAFDPKTRVFTLLGNGRESWHFELPEGNEDYLMHMANQTLGVVPE